MIFLNISISTIIALITTIFLVYEYVYKFYAKLKHYPRGPMPLPIVGNCLMLTKAFDHHLSYFFENLANKYGGSYTFWLATKPIVFINEISLAKEAFNKNEFSDRFEPHFVSQFIKLFLDGHKTFVGMNISDEFNRLRNISSQSIRKFSANQKLSKIVNEVVLDTVSVIKQRESGDAFVPFKYIESIIIGLIIEIIFGKKITSDDKFIEQISTFFERFQKIVIQLFVCEFIPVNKYFHDWTGDRKLNKITVNSFRFWYNNYVKQGLTENNFSSIGEAINSLANAARIKTPSNYINEYLSESNIIGTLITLYLAASDTTTNTFKWILLLMAYYPEMQQKMRNEINDKIGNTKIADLSDKEKCVYVNAFICETLRYRNVLPLSLAHMTSSDTSLGDIEIPKGTSIVLNLFSILNDSRYWKNPNIFNPKRFLDTEQNLIASKMSSFIPFGTGKRMCIGDKIAMNILFFALTSLLQATNGMTFVLTDKQSTNLDPNNFGLFLVPKIFNVRLVND